MTEWKDEMEEPIAKSIQETTDYISQISRENAEAAIRVIAEKVRELPSRAVELVHPPELEIIEINGIQLLKDPYDIIKRIQEIEIRLRTAAQQLVDDTNRIYTTGTNVGSVLFTEMGKISKATFKFSTDIYNATKPLIKESMELGREMTNTANAMNAPLNDAIRNTKSAESMRREIYDELYDLYKHLKSFDAYKCYRDVKKFRSYLNTFVDDAGDALAYITYRNGGVLTRSVQGFRAMGKEMMQFSQAYGVWANVMYNAPKELANVIRTSMNNVSEALNDFSGSLGLMGAHLADNLGIE